MWNTFGSKKALFIIVDERIYALGEKKILYVRDKWWKSIGISTWESNFSHATALKLLSSISAVIRGNSSCGDDDKIVE